VCACSAIIGTRDLTFVEGDTTNDGDGGDVPRVDGATDGNGGNGNPDGGPGVDGSTPIDGAPSTCTANLQTDPAHCGACNHSCLGGACKDGRCQAVPLVQGQHGPWGIAVDNNPGGNVYWVNDSDTDGDDAVLKIGKDGKNLVQLAHTPAGRVSSPRGVAVDDSFVYWASSSAYSSIAKCAITGCANSGILITDDVEESQDVAIDGTHAYWIEKLGARVGRALKTDGGAATTLTGGLYAVGPVDYSIAVDSTHVYFAARNVIGRVAKTASTPDGGATFETIVNDVYTVGIAVDDTNVYWATEDNPGLIQYAPKGGLPQGAVPTALASDQPNPHAIAVDAKNVYWVNFGPGVNTFTDGSVMMCPKTGCAASGPVELASKQANPKDIAVDDVAVYWTANGYASSDGAVMKIAK
jgi:hypothetical protein